MSWADLVEVRGLRLALCWGKRDTIVAVDVRELAFSREIPTGIDEIIPINPIKWSRKHLTITAARFSKRYEGLRPLLLPQCFHGCWKRKRRPGGRRLSV